MTTRAQHLRTASLATISIALATWLATGAVTAAANSSQRSVRSGTSSAQLPDCPSVSGWTFIDRTGNPDPDMGGSFDCNYEKPGDFGQTEQRGIRATFVGPVEENPGAVFGTACGEPDFAGTDNSSTHWARTSWTSSFPDFEAPSAELLASVEQIAQHCEQASEPSPSPISPPSPSPTPTEGAKRSFEWSVAVEAAPWHGFDKSAVTGTGSFVISEQPSNVLEMTVYGLEESKGHLLVKDKWNGVVYRTRLKVVCCGYDYSPDDGFAATHDKLSMLVRVKKSDWKNQCDRGDESILHLDQSTNVFYYDDVRFKGSSCLDRSYWGSDYDVEVTITEV